MNEDKIAQKFPRSIPEELHEAWKRMKRRGDPEAMVTEFGYSRPVIDRALIYGYVTFTELPDKINRYFMDRLKREKSAAVKLNRMQDELENGEAAA